MDITQTLITIAAIVGIIVIGLLAIVPTVIELPGTHSEHHDAADPPDPTPAPDPQTDHHRPDSMDLAA